MRSLSMNCSIEQQPNHFLCAKKYALSMMAAHGSAFFTPRIGKHDVFESLP